MRQGWSFQRRRASLVSSMPCTRTKSLTLTSQASAARLRSLREPGLPGGCRQGMRRLTICIALVLSLAFASDAVAKKVVAAKVCGPSECRDTRDRGALAAFEEGGPPTDPPRDKSGWYSVRVTIAMEGAHDEHFTMVAVPRAGLIRGGDASQGYVWAHISPQAVRTYRRLTRGI